MKKTLMTIIILWTGPVYGQSFEGTLSYISDFELAENMKKMGMTKEMLHDKMKQDGSYSDTIIIVSLSGIDFITILHDFILHIHDFATIRIKLELAKAIGHK